MGQWGPNYCETSEDHFTIVWSLLTQQFQRRSLLSDFLPNFLFLVMADILAGAKIHLKIISSETDGPVGPKLL
jgi:Flp pilus assembly protein TadB